MKNVKWWSTALLAGAVALSMNATAGEKEGNGGDGVSMEFRALALSLGVQLEQWQERPDVIDIQRLHTVAQQTVVSSEPESADVFSLCGATKDAVNFPSAQKVVVNRQRWNDLDQAAKYGLVLHEILGLGGLVENENQSQDCGPTEYSVSTAFTLHMRNTSNDWNPMPVGWVSVCERSTEIQKYLTERFEKSCEKISPRDLASIRKATLKVDFTKDGPLEIKLGPADLAGFSELESLILDVKKNGVFEEPRNVLILPRQYFRFTLKMKSLSIDGLAGANVQFSNRVFEFGPYFESVDVQVGASNLICQPQSFLGLNAEMISFSSSSLIHDGELCSLNKVNGLRDLEIDTWASAAGLKIPWEKLPARLSRLSISVDRDLELGHDLPSVFPKNMHSITDLTINGPIQTKDDQFASLPNLKRLRLVFPKHMSKNGLRGTNLEWLSLFCLSGKNSADTEFLVPVRGLKTLTLNGCAFADTLDFSSQSSVEELIVAHQLTKKMLAPFKNLRVLRYQKKWDNPADPVDLFAGIVGLERVYLYTFFDNNKAPNQFVYFDFSANPNLHYLELRPFGSEETKEAIRKYYEGRLEVKFNKEIGLLPY